MAVLTAEAMLIVRYAIHLHASLSVRCDKIFNQGICCIWTEQSGTGGPVLLLGCSARDDELHNGTFWTYVSIKHLKVTAMLSGNDCLAAVIIPPSSITYGCVLAAKPEL